MSKTVPFTEEAVKRYLDGVITHWRMCDSNPMTRSNYIDAYQSVRISIFGELLPQEEIEPGNPAEQETSA